jgi:histidine triad (HIT) family protein
MTNCIFCRIVAGDIPAKIVASSAHALAFHDLNPQAPTHVLVIPTQHYDSVSHAESLPDGVQVLGEVLALATRVATNLGLDDRGYRLVTNTGPDAGQSVDHLHFHLLGGRQMNWPPG